MTKLEWCRANAPEALANLSDADLLDAMESSYQKFGKDVVEAELESVEYNPINKQMDFMVLTLVREFGDKIAFKGGYMLTKLMPETARQTTDIDFSIASSDLYQSLIATMDKIGRFFVSQGMIDRYVVKQEIREFMSGGMDMYDATGKKVLGIDVGWRDLSFGLTSINIGITDVKAFTVERMLSDKVTAILSRKRFRRPKDIYDLYCITNCFDFDVDEVNRCILIRTNYAGAEWRNYPFNPDVIREYEKAYNKLALNSIVRGGELERPPFDAVMYRFNTICDHLKNPLGNEIWNAKRGVFDVR